jgi:hypothetical protein
MPLYKDLKKLRHGVLVHQKGKGIGELHHVLFIVIYHNTYHDHDPTSICSYEVLIFNSGTRGKGHDIQSLCLLKIIFLKNEF